MRIHEDVTIQTMWNAPDCRNLSLEPLRKHAGFHVRCEKIFRVLVRGNMRNIQLTWLPVCLLFRDARVMYAPCTNAAYKQKLSNVRTNEKTLIPALEWEISLTTGIMRIISRAVRSLERHNRLFLSLLLSVSYSALWNDISSSAKTMQRTAIIIKIE